jgi:hypothetical protein
VATGSVRLFLQVGAGGVLVAATNCPSAAPQEPEEKKKKKPKLD